MRQVISISATGAISGLQVKPGRGMDLRQFGKASIERASEILWSETHQAWKIKITKGLYKGLIVTAQFFTGTAYMPVPSTARLIELSPVLNISRQLIVFNDYDDAVQAEIALLDRIRELQGSTVL